LNPPTEAAQKRSVRLKIENFGSTSPARGGFQSARNNGTKADNPNGMKADNHNGTKADNPNGTKALNFHTHRSEVSTQSCSWQWHYDTRCLPHGLHDLVHFRHLLLRGLQLSGQVRSRLLCDSSACSVMLLSLLFE
jgi:hypothetical protein